MDAAVLEAGVGPWWMVWRKGCGMGLSSLEKLREGAEESKARAGKPWHFG